MHFIPRAHNIEKERWFMWMERVLSIIDIHVQIVYFKLPWLKSQYWYQFIWQLFGSKAME